MTTTTTTTAATTTRTYFKFAKTMPSCRRLTFEMQTSLQPLRSSAESDRSSSNFISGAAGGELATEQVATG